MFLQMMLLMMARHPRAPEVLFVLAGLWVLAGRIPGARGLVVSRDERLVEAFDCSAPSHLEPVEEATDAHCDIEEPIHRRRPAQMRLLQKATYTRIEIRKCTWIQDVVTKYCGNYDHETSIQQLTTYQQVKEVSVAECLGYLDDLTWTEAKTARVEPLKMSAVTHFVRSVVGKTTIQRYHVDCEGGVLNIPGMGIFEDIIQTEHVSLTLETMDGDVSNLDGSVTVGGMRLLDPAGNGGSVSGTGTYTWKDPKVDSAQACHLYNPRPDHKTNGILKGEIMTTDEGAEWFQSLGDGHVKVQLKAAITECNRSIHPTNYAILYITEDLTKPEFARALPVQEQSISTYMNQQDSFIHDVLRDEITRTLNQAIRVACQQDEAKRRTAYARIAAEKSAALDGETVALDEGWFITRAGDGWHRYQCRRLYAEAVILDSCFSGLPVRMNDEDLAIYQRLNFMGPPEKARVNDPKPASDVQVVEGTETNKVEEGHETKYDPLPADRQFFVTPVSHRLTLSGAPRPCVPNMPGLYRNKYGRWLAVSPGLTLETVNPSEKMNSTRHRLSAIANFNAEGGGIYLASDMRLQEEMQQVPRWKDDLSTKMARTIMHNDQYDPNSSDENAVFRRMPDVGLAWLAGLWAMIDRLAGLMAIVLGFLAIFRLMAGSFGCVIRCFAVWEQFGCGPGMCAAAAPRWLSIGGTQKRVAGWYWRNRRFNPEAHGRYAHGSGAGRNLELGLGPDHPAVMQRGLAPSAPSHHQGLAAVAGDVGAGFERGVRWARATAPLVPGAATTLAGVSQVVTAQPVLAAAGEAGVRFSRLLRQDQLHHESEGAEGPHEAAAGLDRGSRQRRSREAREARRASRLEYPRLPATYSDGGASLRGLGTTDDERRGAGRRSQ